MTSLESPSADDLANVNGANGASRLRWLVLSVNLWRKSSCFQYFYAPGRARTGPGRGEHEAGKGTHGAGKRLATESTPVPSVSAAENRARQEGSCFQLIYLDGERLSAASLKIRVGPCRSEA